MKVNVRPRTEIFLFLVDAGFEFLYPAIRSILGDLLD